MKELAQTFFGLCLIVAGSMWLQSQEKPAQLPEPTPKLIGKGFFDLKGHSYMLDLTLPKATPREIQRFADRICRDKYHSAYLTEKSYDCL